MSEATKYRNAGVLAERGFLPPKAADCARDQELKKEPRPCLINSAGSSTYPAWKSVRTTRATAA
jgi:hypothetical protein